MMELWHKQNLNKLISRIVEQFSYLSNKCAENNTEIYAMAMNANSFCTTSYMTVAARNQSQNESSELNWELDEWVITVDDGIYADDFLDQFNKDIREYFGEIMLPKIQNGADEKLEVEKNIKFYIQALKESKLILMNEISPSVRNVVFILSVKDYDEVAFNSANEINETSAILESYFNSI